MVALPFIKREEVSSNLGGNERWTGGVHQRFRISDSGLLREDMLTRNPIPLLRHEGKVAKI